MNYLFLDVDGVLNNTESLKSQKTFYALDTSCINQLRRIHDAVPGLRIVLSSFWRFMPDSVMLLGVRLREKDMDIYDTTQKNFSMGVERGKEIDAWLEHNDHVGEPAIALDDDRDVMDSEHSRYVITDCNLGLTEERADSVIALFSAWETTKC